MISNHNVQKIIIYELHIGKNMKAVGLKEYLPIENDNSLFDFEADNPAK